jgi:hypothetical protein
LEIITVKIGSTISNTYEGFAGTFASLADSCLRKKVLPGVYEKNLELTAELKDGTLFLSLSEGYSDETVISLMATALKNVGGYPASGGEARYSVEVKK